MHLPMGSEGSQTDAMNTGPYSVSLVRYGVMKGSLKLNSRQKSFPLQVGALFFSLFLYRGEMREDKLTNPPHPRPVLAAPAPPHSSGLVQWTVPDIIKPRAGSIDLL